MLKTFLQKSSLALKSSIVYWLIAIPLFILLANPDMIYVRRIDAIGFSPYKRYLFSLNTKEIVQKDEIRIAIRMFEHSIALKPNFSLGYEILGTMHYTLGENNKALSYYTTVVDQFKPSPFSFYNMALIYYQQNEVDHCLNNLKKAKTLLNKETKKYTAILKILKTENKQAKNQITEQLQFNHDLDKDIIRLILFINHTKNSFPKKRNVSLSTTDLKPRFAPKAYRLTEKRIEGNHYRR